jgi:hypothetical protein
VHALHKTQPMADGPDRKRPDHEHAAIPPLADPAEAVERIVPRRQLLVEDGDVLIVPIPGALQYMPRQQIYGLRVRGSGPIGGRYVTFEHASAAGDELALRRQVRLFYVAADGDGEIPHLLKDYRPPRGRG